ncbi:MAG TPA: hypothetical protein VLE72_03640 [Candidatus Saccharimonadales bacterium]|nr:hypothetical protein [Candidatus Saccharimonadales bacterium]
MRLVHQNTFAIQVAQTCLRHPDLPEGLSRPWFDFEIATSKYLIGRSELVVRFFDRTTVHMSITLLGADSDHSQWIKGFCTFNYLGTDLFVGVELEDDQFVSKEVRRFTSLHL